MVLILLLFSIVTVIITTHRSIFKCTKEEKFCLSISRIVSVYLIHYEEMFHIPKLQIFILDTTEF